MTYRNAFRTFAAAAVLGGAAVAVQAPASAQADPNKVLRVAFEASDDGFNLTRVNSLYSNTLAEGVLEPLLGYDYLARPATLIPNTAEALPEVTDNGKTYTFRLKKGIFFTPDEAFKGQKRELTAADYAYVVRRHLDPAVRSVHAGTFRGKIVGMDALVEKAKTTGKYDYDTPIPGLEVVDRYTLRIRLNDPDHTFVYQFTHPGTGAIAREVVEHYGEEKLGRHPVGTGPYMLKDYVPHSKIVLVANPDYRGFTWDFKSSGDPRDEEIIRQMKGKKMPRIGRIEVNIIGEEQARWLAFDSKQLDFAELSPPASPKVLDGDKLKPEFVARGVRLDRYVDVGTRYTFFNMKDPVLGGYSKEKIALRRAIAMSYDYREDIRHAWYGQALKAQSMIPPGVAGHDPKYRTSIGYDPVLAAKLLDHFGYKKGADGWRTMPDGSPLVIKIHSDQKSRDVAKREVWKKSLDKLGIRVDFPISNFADNLKAAYRCEVPMWGLGGVMVSVPDGLEAFHDYYGPNAMSGNLSCYDSKEFNAAYDQARLLPDGPERNALFQKMQRIVEADTAALVELWQIRNWIVHPWVQGFKRHPNIRADWKYIDIDTSKKN